MVNPDLQACVELTLYLDNTYSLYLQRGQVEAMLAKRIAKGTYDASKAPQAYRALVDVAARQYAREYANGVGDAKRIFPGPVRAAVAADYAKRFERSIEQECLEDLSDEAARILQEWNSAENARLA